MGYEKGGAGMKEVFDVSEVKLVPVSLVEEARQEIKRLYATRTSGGQYMATGGSIILQILGLQEEERRSEQ